MPKDPRKAKGAAIETRDKTKRAPAKERTEGTEPAQVPSETFRAASRPEASVRLASQPPRSDLAPSIFIPFFLAAIKDRAHPFEPPPHDFDPLSATNAALESFGLPTRPDPAAEDQFLFWGRMLGPPLEIIR